MAESNFSRVTNTGSETHFSKALFGQVESSRMTAAPVHLTTFNAGDIVPVYCAEVLPDDIFSIDTDFVIRQTTLLTPTMGNMTLDLYAFFVPNRIVNQSWKAVMGENYNGSWTVSPISLAPLKSVSTGTTQIPVGSVADYYGFPTQSPIPNSILNLCNDLKFRGYVMIYNERFRDQNYQPPIPMSTLNVYQGFLDSSSSNVSLSDAGGAGATSVGAGTFSDGSFGAGAIKESLYGSGGLVGSVNVPAASPAGRFRAISAPLKANKLHDYFTSVLPSPQKSSSPVFAPVSGTATVAPLSVITSLNSLSGAHLPLQFRNTTTGSTPVNSHLGVVGGALGSDGTTLSPPLAESLFPSNLETVAGNVDVQGLALSVNDIRMASAIQQVYETLARGGSRYREYIRSFFGLEVDDPFSDIPQYLGHIRRDLDLFQTAQTSSTTTGANGSPQGNLAAFGYTATGGHLFNQRFAEHGYVHILAVVRQKNVYSSFMSRDNFRLSMLDFYQPQLANISEQPVYAREINPFGANAVSGAFGYQEAWAEYRFEPNRVSGYMRPGVTGSLSLWNYADDFSSTLNVADGEWLKSNAQQVLDRSLAVTSAVAPQFKAQFRFIVDKTRPMPTYSVPGMDII